MTAQPGLCRTWSETPGDWFCRDASQLLRLLETIKVTVWYFTGFLDAFENMNDNNASFVFMQSTSELSKYVKMIRVMNQAHSMRLGVSPTPRVKEQAKRFKMKKANALFCSFHSYGDIFDEASAGEKNSLLHFCLINLFLINSDIQIFEF